MRKSELLGNPLPRLRTPSRPADQSRSEQLALLAEAIGLPLLPWQRTVVDDALKRDNDRYIHRTVVTCVSRQNGKTHLLRMRILGGLFLWDEKLIVATAQNREVAKETFTLVADVINATPWLKSEVDVIRWANGQEEIRTKSGNRYKLVAPNGGARGLSADLVIIDELREHKDDEAYNALAYTQQARRDPQMWLASNAGDSSAVVLNRVRDQALKAIGNGKHSDLLYMEWSGTPNCGLNDRKEWRNANPALGHLIDESVIAGRLDSGASQSSIRVEMLCQWVDSITSPWTDGAWANCLDTNLELQPGLPTWLAVDFTWDRTGAYLVGGQKLDDDRIAIGLIQEWKSDASMDVMPIAGVVAEWAKKYQARGVAMLRDGGLHLAPILTQSRIPVSVLQQPSFAQACDEMLSAMNGGRLVHKGQALLTDHIQNVARVPFGETGWRIGRKDSTSPVQAAVASALVIHHLVPRQSIATIVSI